MFGRKDFIETDNFMPLPLELSHTLLRELSAIRKEGKVMKYLRPDAKSQVTIEYSDDHKPVRIDTIVISTQHDDFAKEAEMLAQIKKDVINVLVPRVMKKLPKRVQALFNNKINYHVNPTGKFVIGGPHGDTGLTGRKIIVDTYGGKGAHGGGAFSDLRTTNASSFFPCFAAACNIAVATGSAPRVNPPTAS